MRNCWRASWGLRDEAAFEALVRRHGPMVLGVCQRVLHHGHDAEDAFQATFVVLLRKADTIRPREKVGRWLYGVAYRTATKARVMSAKRRRKERLAECGSGNESPADLAEIECSCVRSTSSCTSYRKSIANRLSSVTWRARAARTPLDSCTFPKARCPAGSPPRGNSWPSVSPSTARCSQAGPWRWSWPTALSRLFPHLW